MAEELGMTVQSMLAQMTVREFELWKTWRRMNNEVTQAQTGDAPLSFELAWNAVFNSPRK